MTAERVDVGIGTLITNVVAAFIVVACAATLWANGITNITDAGQAAEALGPLVGPAATVIFGLGLLAASLLGLGVVPLASAYTATEAFGWEAGIDYSWRQAPAFYGILAFIIGFSALFVLIPGLPLITVMFLAQVLNGILLPFILVFVMLLARDRRIMGDLANGRVAQRDRLDHHGPARRPCRSSSSSLGRRGGLRPAARPRGRRATPAAPRTSRGAGPCGPAPRGASTWPAAAAFPRGRRGPAGYFLTVTFEMDDCDERK